MVRVRPVCKTGGGTAGIAHVPPVPRAGAYIISGDSSIFSACVAGAGIDGIKPIRFGALGAEHRRGKNGVHAVDGVFQPHISTVREVGIFIIRPVMQ